MRDREQAGRRRQWKERAEEEGAGEADNQGGTTKRASSTRSAKKASRTRACKS
jgi:hypothetical protein